MSGRSVQAAVSALLAGVMAIASVGTASAQPAGPQAPQGAQQGRAPGGGRARVIVELQLATPSVPEANLPAAAIGTQRQAIAATRGQILTRLPAGSYRVLRQYLTVPYVALEVDDEALTSLAAGGAGIARVFNDEILLPVLTESVPLIEGDQAWAAGYDGTGTVIAVLDTGVDGSHPFLTGKVVEEACFSTTQAGLSESFCPNGQEQQIGTGAAVPCTLTDCFHGTHVAGIAAGYDPAASIAGVARGAQVFAIQVFSRILDPQSCGGTAPCAGAFTSDVIAGLERVYAVTLAGQRPVVAVNMSLGGNIFTSTCDNEPYKPIIDNLRTIGVATVVAAGNSAVPFGLSTPACISTAISVGSTTKNDEVSWFSNAASFLSLFAPGESITSSVTGGTYEAFSGTSMAAPHVAGAWSVLRQAAPTASVSTILSRLRSTGLTIRDTRFLGSANVPRVRLFRALATFVPVTSPAPAIASTDPSHAKAGAGPIVVTVHGGGFSTFSVVRWNGAARSTRLVSTTALQVTIPASDLVAQGTAQISVFTPTPGGGTSASLVFTIDPPPTLTVSSALVGSGASVTVTLTNGYGGPSDYLALAATSAPNTSYLQWTYVGSGITDRTWTVNMPTTAGTYEFRLFVDDVRRATSPAVTVDPSVSPAPVANSLSPGSVVAGAAPFTLSVTGSAFTSSSVVRWNGANRPTTYVSATQLQAAIAAADVATTGVAQVAVFTPAPGGGLSAALTFTIRPTPSLTVSATSAAGGTAVTVTLTNGLGGSSDWLALAATGSPNTSYVQYTYVGGGVTTRTWTVSMPLLPGTYEFRLLALDNTRLATSPAVSVTGPTLTVNATTTTTGSPVTVTLANGFGGAGDWLALAPTTAPDSSYVQYTYIGTNVTTRTWTVSMPGTPGTYEFRAFVNYGYTRVATSAAITVTQGAPFITSLAPASIRSGSTGFTLTVNGGAFTPASVVRWNGANRATTFVNATQLTAAISAADIASAGTAQVTAFTPGAGSSSALPFVIVGPPTLTVSSTSIAAGGSVTVTLTDGFGASSDWLAIAQVGAPNNSYLESTFVGTGVTTRTWTVTIPTAGTYEFRLFQNSFTRVATSPPITVAPGPSPILTVSATTAERGMPVTLTLSNSPGGSLDWLAFAATASPNTSFVQWVWVGAGVTSRTWTVTMPNTPGTYEFRLFLNNGYTRAGTSATIVVP